VVAAVRRRRRAHPAAVHVALAPVEETSAPAALRR
jgi:hypothetical protein